MSANESHKQHIMPLRTYLAVAAALFVLTAITVIVAQFHFGEFNLIVAMAIAAVKASLVALFFMHLKYDSKIYMVIFLIAIIFLALFIILTLADTLERDQIYELKSKPIQPEARIYRQGTTDSLGGVLPDSASVDSTALENPESPH